jgi:8-oxo-dGTP diphosphatase
MQPKVGVGVFCFKPTGEFILGKRKGSIGAGKY